ncbi:acyl-CoA dehydrogenase [Streptomyces sp. NPDC098077]|uniref:acyl-CoA dehydrogenase family protein n=1 Tax=Streptomyces sp. NPDC098077 TaxID=3366093 RepID=UPI00380E19CE
MTLLTIQSHAPRTIGAANPTEATISELTHQLFDGHDRDRVHGAWRGLIANEEFHYRPGLSATERTALSYERLRIINQSIDSAASLALDPQLLASLHEWTGVVDGGLGTLAGIHYNLFLGSLLDHDNGEWHQLSDYTSMQRTGTFLCTELNHGNDVAALETTCELDRATNEFVLHTPTPGAIKFMPNTSLIGGPKSAVVASRLLVDGQDRGVFLFLTPLSDETGLRPGIRVRPLPERLGSPVDHCLTSFDRVRLPREALLEGEHGRLTPDAEISSSLGSPRKRFLHSIRRVTWGKLCMSAASVGVSRAALSIAVRRSQHRTVGGTKVGERVPVSAHRSHHSRLLHAVASTYAMTFLHRDVLGRWVDHSEEERGEIERLIAVSKGWITWQSREITLECRERCGAAGLFRFNGLADITQNLEGTITAEGDNLVIWVKAAAEMLFEHRTEKPPPSPLPLEEQSLTDLSFLRGLLAGIEHLWQLRARAALRRGPSGNPLARWNRASAAGIEMVSAHARLQAADAFLAAIGRTEQPSARSMLEALYRLFLLQELTRHTGDLLAEGYLTPSHVRELPTAVDALMDELAPHLPLLVEAFDLPEEFLASIPLANSGPSILLDDLLLATATTPPRDVVVPQPKLRLRRPDDTLVEGPFAVPT